MVPRQKHIEYDTDFELEDIVEFEDICELYRHFTYIVSIFGSLAIFCLSFFVESCDDVYQNYINTIIFVKSFCVYGSTPIEYVHHVLQLGLTCIGNNMKVCDENGVFVFKVIDSILVTPMFQNIKYYFNVQKGTIMYNSLDAMFVYTFFYYRIQFNYVVWSGILSNALDFTIEENNIIYKETTKIVFKIGMYILTFMNVYWMYLILRKVNKKYYKTLKDE